MANRSSLPPKVRFSQHPELLTSQKFASESKKKTYEKPKIINIEHVKIPIKIVNKPSEIQCDSRSTKFVANDASKDSTANIVKNSSYNSFVLNNIDKKLKTEKPITSCSIPNIVVTDEKGENVNIKLTEMPNSSINKILRENLSVNTLANKKSVNSKPFSSTAKSTSEKMKSEISKKTPKTLLRVGNIKNMKKTDVKKTVIRNITSKTPKAIVKPGIFKCENSKTIEKSAKRQLNSRISISGEKLNKPEYNSITCTINKFHEVQNKKVIPDLENLPSSYKNLITAKVSSNLDFPVTKAIFKNLVDLSIDDKNLPSRLTRSKDPEPRQKDITPKLSDFFTPKYAYEYCESLFISPRESQIVNNYNASKIIDKIRSWETKLDKF